MTYEEETVRFCGEEPSWVKSSNDPNQSTRYEHKAVLCSPLIHECLVALLKAKSEQITIRSSVWILNDFRYSAMTSSLI